jgi:DNA-binding transcriptional LysR family regulator
MELRHLRYFVALARRLHFGHAAQDLRIAQPSLSQQIRDLENELDVKLFTRTKRRVGLTHAGQVYLAEAQHILSRAEAAARAARSAGRGNIGSLALAFGPVAAHVLLPFILVRYRACVPGVDVRIEEGLMTDVVRAVTEGNCDVGFTLPYFRSEILKSETVLRLPLVAALPASHRLGGSKSISLKQLPRENFILISRRRGAGFFELVTGLCQRAGFVPNAWDGLEHFSTLLSMVAAGYGISLVPTYPPIARKTRLALVPLKEKYATIEIAMIWRAKDLSPLVAGFLHEARISCRGEERRLSAR